MKKLILSQLLFFLCYCLGFSQLTDSIKKELLSIQKIKNEKEKGELLFQFTKKHLFENAEISYKNSLELISLFKKSKDNEKLGSSYNICGLAANNLEKPDLALLYFDSCKSIGIKTKDSVLLLKAYMNSGIAYEKKNDFNSAFKFYVNSRKLAEQMNDAERLANVYGNLGNVLLRLNRSKEAIGYFEKSIEIFTQLNKKIPLANQYNSISQAYDDLNNRKNQRKYLEKALSIYEEENDLFHLGTVYTNISSLEMLEKNYEKSFIYLSKGINSEKLLGDKVGLGTLYSNYINLAIKTKKYKEGLAAVDSAYAVANEIKDIYLLFNIKKNHAELLTHFNRLDEAYDLMAEAINMLDTINGVTAQKAVAEYQEKYESEKKQFMIEKLEKNKKINELKIEQNKNTIAKQNAQRNLIIGVLISVLIILVVLFQNFQQKKKSNEILKSKNEIIEKNNLEINQAYDEIKIQKEEITEKNKEILDSIHYAQRIQKALITNSNFIKKQLPEHFIFFQPKDIVSGDFFWSTTIKRNESDKGLFFLAVCDCTGHGVPGAFMSLLNIAFLNEAINEKNIYEPHLIFNFVRERLISNLSSDGQKDGMDGILLSIDNENRKIKYAAANNAPVLVSNGIIRELEYDKMPVGKGEKEISFTTFELNYAPGDSLYMYTDGYADQFGGPKGKKFKYKPLNELLVSVSSSTSEIQINEIQEKFFAWKGNLEQVDDVCVFGTKLI